MDSLCWDNAIHGHHVYEDIWNPFVAKILCVEQETHSTDHFSITIMKAETIIGHVPYKVSFRFHHYKYY